jgi:hypothetical protein
VSSILDKLGLALSREEKSVILAITLPLTLLNFVLSAVRSLGVYSSFASDMLQVDTISAISLLDTYFAIAQILIFLYAGGLWFHKQKRISSEVEGEENPFVMFRSVILGFLAISILAFFAHSPVSKLITDFVYDIPFGSSTSPLGRMFELAFAGAPASVFLQIALQSWRLFCLIIGGTLLAGPVIVPAFRYQKLQTIESENITEGHGILWKIQQTMKVYFDPGTISRVLIFSLFFVMGNLALTFPEVMPLGPGAFRSVLNATIEMFLLQGSTSISTSQVLGIIGVAWLSSIAFYSATSEIRARHILSHIWVTRKDEILLVLIAMLASIALTPFMEDSWISSLAVGIGSSVALHRMVIQSFVYFDDNAEAYIVNSIQAELSKMSDVLLIVGGGWIGRSMISDLIPSMLVEMSDESIIELWPDGPKLKRIQGGRRKVTYLLQGAVFIDPSDGAVRLLGSHPQLGPYGCIDFSVPHKHHARVRVDVRVPAVMAKAGTGRTPMLERASVVVMTSNDPQATHMIQDEIDQLIAETGRSPAALMVRSSGGAQVYQLARRGKTQGVPVVNHYIERELGYHTGLSLIVGTDCCKAAKDSVQRKSRNKKVKSLDIELLIICDGKPRIYYTVEALYMHGRMEKSDIEIDAIPVMRAAILTDSPTLLQRCVEREGPNGPLLLYQVTFNPHDYRDGCYVPVIGKSQTFSRIYRIISENPVKGIVVSMNQMNQTIEAVASISAPIQEKMEQGLQVPYVVVSAVGESDLVATMDFLRRSKIPSYAFDWLQFVSGQMNSVLQSLKTGSSRDSIDKTIPALAGLVRNPTVKLVERLYCPVAALFEADDGSESESRIVVQKLSGTGRAIHVCMHNNQLSTPKLLEALVSEKAPTIGRTSIEEGVSFDRSAFLRRRYSMLSVCLDDYPGALHHALTILSGERLSLGIESSQNDVHYITSFECILNRRTGLTVFANTRNPDDEEQTSRTPIKLVTVLAGNDLVENWTQFLSARLPDYEIGVTPMPGQVALVVCKREGDLLMQTCERGTCAPMCLANEIETALESNTPITSKTTNYAMSLHFIHAGTCRSSESHGSGCANISAFARLYEKK